jgi:hypothetical protein
MSRLARIASSGSTEFKLGIYPEERVDRLYAGLTAIKPKQFYQGQRVNAGIGLDGSVDFTTYYPEISYWSYKSPEEKGIVRTSPKPVRELILASAAFKNHLETSESSRTIQKQTVI